MGFRKQWRLHEADLGSECCEGTPKIITRNCATHTCFGTSPFERGSPCPIQKWDLCPHSSNLGRFCDCFDQQNLAKATWCQFGNPDLKRMAVSTSCSLPVSWNARSWSLGQLYECNYPAGEATCTGREVHLSPGSSHSHQAPDMWVKQPWTLQTGPVTNRIPRGQPRLCYM